MRALVLYESMFGNTRLIAEQIRDGLAETWDTDLRSVDDPGPVDLARYGLVVIGGPTHAFTMSTSRSRAQARRPDGGVDPNDPGSGVRDWIPRLGRRYSGRIAVFDTRVGRIPWAGSASRSIRRQLRRLGHRVVARRSFVVVSKRGPLREGDLYTARVWGSELAVGARPSGRRRAAGRG